MVILIAEHGPIFSVLKVFDLRPAGMIKRSWIDDAGCAFDERGSQPAMGSEMERMTAVMVGVVIELSVASHLAAVVR